MPANYSPQALATLRAQIVTVDQRLREVLGGVEGALVDAALHLISAGGRRLRPALVLSSAVAAGGWEAISSRVIDAAVVLELLHQASLHHDDVLDAAPVRRGHPSVNASWGNRVAILTGDTLLAHAFSLASMLRPEELRRFSQTVADLCSGQVAETQTLSDHRRPIVDYEAAIRKKTAALFASACWLGASTAGAPPALTRALEHCGAELGVAFQLIDDLLDLYGDPAMTGKPCGSDLACGVFTLPVLLALAEDPSLADLLQGPLDENGVDVIRERVTNAHAHRRTARLASASLSRAMIAIQVPELHPEGRQLLVAIAAGIHEPLEGLAFVTASPKRLGARLADGRASQAMPPCQAVEP